MSEPVDEPLFDVSAMDANHKATDLGQYWPDELRAGDHVETARDRRVDYSNGFVALPATHINLGGGYIRRLITR